jgi:hypothetical protein
MTEAYLIKKLIVPQQVNIVFQDLLTDFTQDLKRIFCHIYKTTPNIGDQEYLTTNYVDRFVPISSALFKKEFTPKNYPNWKLLEEANLIERRIINDKGHTYSQALGLSNEFRITEPVYELIIAAYPTTTEEWSKVIRYEVITNKKTTTRVKHILTDETGHPLPKLLTNAMKSFKPCPYNVTSVLEHLEATKNLPSYNNDKACHNAVMEQLVETLDSDLIKYQAHYKHQTTGRLSEIGGCLQSCTRAMKEAAFKDIEGIKNYDLESSQVLLLVQFFEAANISCDWLTNYLNKDKQQFADFVGVSKGCWKQLLLTLIMGGFLPEKINTNSIKLERINEIEQLIKEDSKNLSMINEISRCSINIYLLKEFSGNYEASKAALIKLRQVLGSINSSLSEWHNWLIEKHIPLVSTTNSSGQSISNKAGMSFDLEPYKVNGLWTSDKESMSKLKSRLAAFLLQGAEAAFIHALTYLSNNYEFDCLNGQHDGLITYGEVPMEAIEQAIQQSGLIYAKLIIKPFN